MESSSSIEFAIGRVVRSHCPQETILKENNNMSNNNNVLFVLVADTQKKVPSYGHERDAGMDLFPLTNEDIILQPHETKRVETGIRLLIPKGYWVQLVPRSGLSLKGIVANVGTIDEDYTGDCSIILLNNTDQPVTISHEKALAQMIVQRNYRIPTEELLEVCVTPKLIIESTVNLDEQANIEAIIAKKEQSRGGKGFGSTDKKQ